MVSRLTSQQAEKANYVQRMFTRVAKNYDRMNRLMTAGQDRRWKAWAVRQLVLGSGQRLLDLGCGTGDLARLAKQLQPDLDVIAADFTWQMMEAGKQAGDLPFVTADALATPFPSRSFDSLISGYLLRNVSDVEAALMEQFRLLKPGGRLVILETTRPRSGLLTPFVWLHMHVVIPLLGRLIASQPEAYRYLPNSSEHFLLAEELADRLTRAGFTQVRFRRFMAGTIAVHWANKPYE